MSGIFGIVDPNGPDRALLLRAASVSSFRGKAEVHVSGAVAFGCWRRPGDAEAFHPGARRSMTEPWLVADSRVDAVIPGSSASKIARERGLGENPSLADGLGLLADVLGSVGPGGLEGVASDHAAAALLPSGRLVLARDAVGMRPLFWAASGRRFGFASDPEVLVATGLARGELDRRAVAAYLASMSPGDGVSAFDGVHRVAGGRWVSREPNGSVRAGRWFRPELVPEEPSLELEEAGEAVASVVAKALASRVRVGSAALALTSGVDSGSIAAAASRSAITLDCFTVAPDPSLGTDERPGASELALKLGHVWRTADVGSRPTDDDLHRVPSLQGPLGPPVFPFVLSMLDLLEAQHADVVLDGLGGDPLFSTPPVVISDLIKRGEMSAAARASRGFALFTSASGTRQARAGLLGAMPSSVRLSRLQRRRLIPPWVAGQVPDAEPALGAPRSSREWLIASATAMGESEVFEQGERQVQRVGSSYAAPLLDVRVIRVALSLPARLRAPDPSTGLKPALRWGIPAEFAGTRIKATYRSYSSRLERALVEDHPSISRGILCAEQGFVRAGQMTSVLDRRWEGWLLPVIPLELWLNGER